MSRKIIRAPKFIPLINIDAEEQVKEEKGTIVHFTVHQPTMIRVWPTTFLVQDNGERKKLIQAFNVTTHPQWMLMSAGNRFTLVFEGLASDCTYFDLFEEIPEPGGFHIAGIQRNTTDVYWIRLE